mmetsp:Transcript_98470/g.279023  ORF Transcript_98470/g.279023 Transcript_98470/m.279023 type:complete len:297 (-) Transcript_98470:209-1099(-)
MSVFTSSRPSQTRSTQPRRSSVRRPPPAPGAACGCAPPVLGCWSAFAATWTSSRRAGCWCHSTGLSRSFDARTGWGRLTNLMLEGSSLPSKTCASASLAEFGALYHDQPPWSVKYRSFHAFVHWGPAWNRPPVSPVLRDRRRRYDSICRSRFASSQFLPARMSCAVIVRSLMLVMALWASLAFETSWSKKAIFCSRSRSEYFVSSAGMSQTSPTPWRSATPISCTSRTGGRFRTFSAEGTLSVTPPRASCSRSRVCCQSLVQGSRPCRLTPVTHRSSPSRTSKYSSGESLPGHQPA